MKLRILILAVVALSFISGCKKKEEPTTIDSTSTTTQTVATPTVEALTMASKVDADNNPTNSTSTFSTKDTIWAVADISGTKMGTPIEARWYHTTSNQQINANTVTSRNDDKHRLPFFIANPTGWPKGDYRVDILINGSVMKSATFQVQ